MFARCRCRNTTFWQHAERSMSCCDVYASSSDARSLVRMNLFDAGDAFTAFPLDLLEPPLSPLFSSANRFSEIVPPVTRPSLAQAIRQNLIVKVWAALGASIRDDLSIGSQFDLCRCPHRTPSIAQLMPSLKFSQCASPRANRNVDKCGVSEYCVAGYSDDSDNEYGIRVRVRGNGREFQAIRK